MSISTGVLGFGQCTSQACYTQNELFCHQSQNLTNPSSSPFQASSWEPCKLLCPGREPSSRAYTRADISLDPCCYNPPLFFSSSSDPFLATMPKPPLMTKQPLPLNPSLLPELPPLLPSEPSKPSSPIDQPPVLPLVPVPWNIHRWDYSSMEMYQEPPPVENPLEDPDSPIEDAPPLEPEPITHYKPDIPGGHTKTLSPEESPITPWEEYLTQPSSPVSCKHSLSPTSTSSVPIQQHTSREGSYQSITPSASSPIASTLPQSPGHQSTSSGGSADHPSSMQSSADDADSDMALNWVTINTNYLKG